MVLALSHLDYSHTFFSSFLAELCWWSPEALLLEELVGKRSTFPRDECGWKWEGSCECKRQPQSGELKSEKKSARIDGQRRGRGVKKVRTGLKVQGEDLCYPQREGEKRNKWIEGEKMASICQGSRHWLLRGKRSDGIKAPRGKYRSLNITFVLHTVTQSARVHH